MKNLKRIKITLTVSIPTTNVENFLNVPRPYEKLKTWSCGEKYFLD